MVYQNLTAGQHKQALADTGLPQHYAQLVADSDQGWNVFTRPSGSASDASSPSGPGRRTAAVC